MFAERGWSIEKIDQNRDGHFRVWMPGYCDVQSVRTLLAPLVRDISIARINDKWSIALIP